MLEQLLVTSSIRFAAALMRTDFLHTASPVLIRTDFLRTASPLLLWKYISFARFSAVLMRTFFLCTNLLLPFRECFSFAQLCRCSHENIFPSLSFAAALMKTFFLRTSLLLWRECFSCAQLRRCSYENLFPVLSFAAALMRTFFLRSASPLLLWEPSFPRSASPLLHTRIILVLWDPVISKSRPAVGLSRVSCVQCSAWKISLVWPFSKSLVISWPSFIPLVRWMK